MSIRLFASITAVALLGACASPTASHRADEPALVLVGSGSATMRMDPAEIVSARIEGDLLRLQVRYGGGCAEHDFALLHSGVFMESYPPQTNLDLAHDAKGDRCRALVAREVTFDLTPLKKRYQALYGEHGPLVLHLRAPQAARPVDPPLRYEF